MRILNFNITLPRRRTGTTTQQEGTILPGSASWNELARMDVMRAQRESRGEIFPVEVKPPVPQEPKPQWVIDQEELAALRQRLKG